MCGIGEQKIRENGCGDCKVDKRMWMCGSARGLVLGRVFWRMLKM